MTLDDHDPLLSACARLDWAAAGRHWREGAPPSAERSLSALLTALSALDAAEAAPPAGEPPSKKQAARLEAEEALGMDKASRSEAADAILRPICARACLPLSGRDDARAAHCFQALARQLASHGMHECLKALSEALKGGPLAASMALCLEPLVERWFPLEAKGFLGSLSAREKRLAPESLSAALLECDAHWLPQLRRSLARCEKAERRYWPDNRETLAAVAMASIKARQEAIELYGSACVARASIEARPPRL